MYSIKNTIAQISIQKYIEDYRDSDKFIVFCKECNKYANCWSCPPYDFSTDAFLDDYKYVYIIGTKITPHELLSNRCHCVEDTKSVVYDLIRDVRKTLAQKLLYIENKYSGSCAFFAGTCHFCDVSTCTRITGEPCRFPDKIRYSLEAFGFDIGKTASELLNIELKWSRDGLLPEYITLVSALFSNDTEIDMPAYFTEYHKNDNYPDKQ